MIDIVLFFCLSFILDIISNWFGGQMSIQHTGDLLSIQMQHMIFSWQKETLFHFSSLVTFSSVSNVNFMSNTQGQKNKPPTLLTFIAVEEGDARNCVPSRGKLLRTEQNRRAGLGLPPENSELRMAEAHMLSLIQA